MHSCQDMIDSCKVFQRQNGKYQNFDFDHDVMFYTDGLEQDDYSSEDLTALEDLGWRWGENDCWTHF